MTYSAIGKQILFRNTKILHISCVEFGMIETYKELNKKWSSSMKNLKVADIIYFCMCGQVILIELLFLISMLRIFICSVSAIFSTASRKKSTSLNKTLWFQTVLKGQIASCNLFQFVFLCLYIVSNCPHSDFFFSLDLWEFWRRMHFHIAMHSSSLGQSTDWTAY